MPPLVFKRVIKDQVTQRILKSKQLCQYNPSGGLLGGVSCHGPKSYVQYGWSLSELSSEQCKYI